MSQGSLRAMYVVLRTMPLMLFLMLFLRLQLSFLLTDEFLVRVTKITSRISRAKSSRMDQVKFMEDSL